MSHVRDPRIDVALLAAVIVAGIIITMLVGGCGDNLAPPIRLVDAPVATDAPGPDATHSMPSIWYYAYLDWEEIDCLHTQRCDYQTLEVLFDGSIPDCQEYLAQQDCNRLDPMHGPVNCQSPYPQSRWAFIDQCRDEVAVLPCGLNPPDSCEKAFNP